MSSFESVRIGLVSVSDRASGGVYADQGIPALRDWLARALRNPVHWEERLIPDEQPRIEATLRELVDEAGCHLVLTTGGTGRGGVTDRLHHRLFLRVWRGHLVHHQADGQ